MNGPVMRVQYNQISTYLAMICANLLAENNMGVIALDKTGTAKYWRWNPDENGYNIELFQVDSKSEMTIPIPKEAPYYTVGFTSVWHCLLPTLLTL
jgi:hypothetical protein